MRDKRMMIVAGLLLAVGLAGQATAEEEMTLDTCRAEIARVRELENALPANSLARPTVDSALNTARLEAEGGDLDECPTQIERAQAAVTRPAYVLRPDERLGLPESDMPVPRLDPAQTRPDDGPR